MIPLSYNIRSIARRRFSAGATILGLAMVVAVFALVMMAATGVKKTLKGTGSPANAIFLRKGATSELVSAISRDGAKTFAADPNVAQEGGKAVASPELYVIAQVDRVDGSGPANVAFRGFTADGYNLLRKDTVKVVQGRLPREGTSEVMIGKAALGRYVGATLGGSIKKARREWPVVGVFDADGSAFDSEIWVDVEQLAQAFNRTGFYSTMTVKLRSPSDFPALKAVVDADTRFLAEVKREDDYYESVSGGLTAFITILGTIIAIFFSFGATLGAMITMYAQVASRVREIGTLRALGFRRRTVLLSFIIESLMLSLAGAVVGCAFASLFGLVKFTMVNFGTFTETRFQLSFGPNVAIGASLFAIFMGLVGGILPAIRAARIPIVEATKG
ncbi:MAG: ABC transporter permease [Deltaproteobacteria bacterium]|nr:ABC transporter permease [Deltaproteobacteria bacterium]